MVGRRGKTPVGTRSSPQQKAASSLPGCRQGAVGGAGRLLSLPTAPLCRAPPPPQGMARHGGAGRVWGGGGGMQSIVRG